MLHTKFHGNRPPVLEKKISEVFFTIYAHGCHLGHLTSILLTNFHFLVPEIFHTQFGKIWLEFLYVQDFGPRSRNDLDLQLTYLHKFNKMSAPTNFQVTGCNSF